MPPPGDAVGCSSRRWAISAVPKAHLTRRSRYTGGCRCHSNTHGRFSPPGRSGGPGADQPDVPGKRRTPRRCRGRRSSRQARPAGRVKVRQELLPLLIRLEQPRAHHVIDGLDRPYALPASQLLDRHRLIPRRMLRVLCSVYGHRHLPPLVSPSSEPSAVRVTLTNMIRNMRGTTLSVSARDGVARQVSALFRQLASAASGAGCVGSNPTGGAKSNTCPNRPDSGPPR